jgi:hypothetical protein
MYNNSNLLNGRLLILKYGKDILDNIELRSESVQDILTQPPHWMIRWGNTIIFLILVLILIMSYIIKYPEFIPAPIIVTSQNPPEKLEARTNSKIEKIFIKDHQEVKKDQVLMVMQSSANYKDVLALKKIIDSLSPNQLSSFPLTETSHFKLGELQEIIMVLQKHFRMKPYLQDCSLMRRKI